jgi:hypothetical protein
MNIKNQSKEYNNREIEASFKSFINLVNRYSARPDHSLSSLIKSAYHDFFYLIPPSHSLTQTEKEQADVIISQLNGAYGRYVDKREVHLTSYKRKKYSY